mgnify:CR=1 FL=1
MVLSRQSDLQLFGELWDYPEIYVHLISSVDLGLLFANANADLGSYRVLSSCFINRNYLPATQQLDRGTVGNILRAEQCRTCVNL